MCSFSLSFFGLSSLAIFISSSSSSLLLFAFVVVLLHHLTISILASNMANFFDTKKREIEQVKQTVDDKRQTTTTSYKIPEIGTESDVRSFHCFFMFKVMRIYIYVFFRMNYFTFVDNLLNYLIPFVRQFVSFIHFAGKS